MDHNAVFGLQFTSSMVVYSLLAYWWVSPRLRGLPLKSQLQPLIAVHLVRHLGLTVFAPGAIDSRVPVDILHWIAWGDFAALVLAAASIAALRARVAFAIPLVWVFNVEATADLVHAMLKGMQHDLFQYPMGANWLVVTFVVPALWVTSVMIFYKLLRKSASA